MCPICVGSTETCRSSGEAASCATIDNCSRTVVSIVARSETYSPRKNSEPRIDRSPLRRATRARAASGRRPGDVAPRQRRPEARRLNEPRQASGARQADHCVLPSASQHGLLPGGGRAWSYGGDVGRSTRRRGLRRCGGRASRWRRRGRLMASPSTSWRSLFSDREACQGTRRPDGRVVGLCGGGWLRAAASKAFGMLGNSAVTGVRAGEPEAAEHTFRQLSWNLDIGATVARGWLPPFKPGLRQALIFRAAQPVFRLRRHTRAGGKYT